MSEKFKFESAAGWKWYGFPLHFICGDQCVFHLGTKIGNYVISSVGAMKDKDGKLKTIGLDRTYETMVFKHSGEDKHGNPIISFSEIDMEGYNDSEKAERGHYEMCWKYHHIVEAKNV